MSEKSPKKVRSFIKNNAAPLAIFGTGIAVTAIMYKSRQHFDSEYTKFLENMLRKADDMNAAVINEVSNTLNNSL